MSLRVDVEVTAREVAATFEVPQGRTLGLVGPNGAGKSTVLDVIAGLLKPDRGDVWLGDRDLSRVPAHARRVALLAQRALLFPHLSVLDNVAFGPRSSGASRRESREAASGWLAKLSAEQFAERRPTELSGGQAQRIALARALATEPEILLLDEPLSALDATSVPQLRDLLAEVLSERTAILVSHDADDLVLADSVVELRC